MKTLKTPRLVFKEEHKRILTAVDEEYKTKRMQDIQLAENLLEILSKIAQGKDVHLKDGRVIKPAKYLILEEEEWVMYCKGDCYITEAIVKLAEYGKEWWLE